MSTTLLSRTVSPKAPCLQTGADIVSRRAEAETTLRDLAFVFHLTQRVKSAILSEEPDRNED